jgi:hypothetical protein
MATLADIVSANYIYLITPDDGTDLVAVTRAISFAVAGVLHITDANGNDVTIPDGALVAGVMHPLRVKRVHADTTTCTGIVGFAG